MEKGYIVSEWVKDILKGYFFVMSYVVLDYDFEQVILSILNLHLCSYIGCFQWMFFSLIKEVNRLIRKGISKGISYRLINRLRCRFYRLVCRLLSKLMSNIYLKSYENWCFQNFDYLSLKNSSAGQFLESSNSRRYYWILKLLVAT